MTTLKNKHLSFEDRCIIQEFLDYGYSFTRIGARIRKDRTTVAKEVLHHRFMKGFPDSMRTDGQTSIRLQRLRQEDKVQETAVRI